jgi:NHL repeat
MKRIHQIAIVAISLCPIFFSCTKTASVNVNAGNDSTGSSGTGVTPVPGTVITFAGNGNQGFVNGTGTAAEFGSPIALAVDNLGNVYVVDGLNYCIRKITYNGIVSTLAGNGTSGYVDAQGTKAEFEAPNGIAVDINGNVYVSEGNSNPNHRIRKITPDGTVTTFAGKGISGYTNGVSSVAEFYGPGPMALDASSNLYVGDVINERIRKITGSGVLSLVSTFAGNGNQGHVNGPASSAEFDIPEGLAFDPSGNLYIADELNFCIRKITPSGTVSDFAGSKNNAGFSNGTGNKAQFVNPVAIASGRGLYK